MTNFSRLAISGALISGVLLGGHALYFSSVSVALADALLFLAVVSGWSYLLSRANTGGAQLEPGGQAAQDTPLIHESNTFHVQFGKEVSNQLNSAHTELGNTQTILSEAISTLINTSPMVGPLLEISPEFTIIRNDNILIEGDYAGGTT